MPPQGATGDASTGWCRSEAERMPGCGVMESWSSATKPCFRGASSAEGEAGRSRWGRRGKGGGRRGVPGSRLRCLWPRCLHRRSQPSHGDLGDRSKKVKSFLHARISAHRGRFSAIPISFGAHLQAADQRHESLRTQPAPACSRTGQRNFPRPRFKGTIREPWRLLESLPRGRGTQWLPALAW